jgi:hypothetical protein
MWMHQGVICFGFLLPDVTAVAMFPFQWNSRGWMNNNSDGAYVELIAHGTTSGSDSSGTISQWRS